MRILRAAVSAFLLTATIVGVLVALVAFGRLPTGHELVELPSQMLTDTTAFILLTAAAWLTWALFTAAVVFEVLVEVTGNRSWRLPKGTPFRLTAQQLVAAITMSAALSGPALARTASAGAATTDQVQRSPVQPPPAKAPHPGQPASVTAVATYAQAPADHPLASERPTVTVVVGDSAWGIAERHLGKGLRWREIWDLNRGRPQPDGHTWVTEDLIRPGWRLQLPADAINVAPPPEPAPRTHPHDKPTTDPSPTTSTTSASSTTTTQQPHQASAEGDSTAAEHDRSDSKVQDHSGLDPLPALAGITGATVTAAGLAHQIRRRRRRRTAVSAHTAWATGDPQTDNTEAAIAAASDLPLVRWAGRQLARFLDYPPGQLAGGPVAIELSPETGIEILWEHPNPAAPAPWEPADSGWAWRLPYDPDLPTPANDEPAGIPALVTIGDRQGRQLLIDLEAFGTLNVTGPGDAVADLVRSLIVELSSGEELASAHVVIADPNLDIPGTDQLQRITHEPIEAARRRIDAIARDTSDALQRSACTTTFDYRTTDAWIDTTVVIAPGDHPLAPDLVDLAKPRRGVALIITNSETETPARLNVDPNGTARLEPLGLTFAPAALPTSSAAAVAELLDALDQPAPPDPAAIQDTETRDEQDEIWPQLLVRVLGRPHVPARPKLRQRELALVVYLACKGQPTPAASVQHAVWNGRAVQAKTIWNVVTSTRAALGQLDDGTPAMPASERAHHTISLAPSVRTDLHVLHHLYNKAHDLPSTEAIELLRQGLDLIEGQPFDGADFEWAHHTELLVAQATRLIESAAEQLVELATEADRTDIARHAITQGLRALPGNEVLYRARMTLEHEQGNLASVRAAYDELVTFLHDIDAEPSTATAELYGRLLRRPGRHAS